MQSEKDATFSKERRFRRINVFSRRRISGENAPGKRNDFADVVADREHQATAKAIVEFAITAFFITQDRKSTRLNSSHRCISYAVFCLKKKKKNIKKNN